MINNIAAVQRTAGKGYLPVSANYLSFRHLITLLTKGVRSSLQREIDVFYKEVTGKCK